MEIGSAGDEKISFCSRCLRQLADSEARLVENVGAVARKVKKVGKDDPRRIVHSLKVGLALTLVSIFYYLRPLYNDFGVNALWAVLTVVVVFEYTVGATLGKGLNRVFATLLAGAFAVGVHYLASLSGDRGEPIILGASVFLTATACTFCRFFPGIKARYDYGLVIFILTFSMVAVSSFRVVELIKMAHQRVSTIVIGSFTCVFISTCVCPVWAGEDLHKLVALNIEKLANFLQGFGDEYLKKKEEGESAEVPKDKSVFGAYKSILNSKTTEESLANFARWEPRHGRFRFHHPWHQYLKIGALARQCASSIDALSACASSNNIQAPLEEVQEVCRKMSSESGKALMELSLAIRTMTRPMAAAIHVTGAKAAAKNLKTALKTASSEITTLLEILPAASIALLLVEIVGHVDKLASAVDELAKLANFRNPLHQAVIKPLSDDIIIEIPAVESTSPGDASSQEPLGTRCADV